jgi:anti-sigma factor RsiW
VLTCREIAERVTDYIERDLPWRDRLRYRAHLALCAACRRYVSQMRQASALLRRLGTLDTARRRRPLRRVSNWWGMV